LCTYVTLAAGNSRPPDQVLRDPDLASSFLNIRDPDGHLIEVSQTTLPGGWRQFLNP
jgi:hypothetical protein